MSENKTNPTLWETVYNLFSIIPLHKTISLTIHPLNPSVQCTHTAFIKSAFSNNTLFHAVLKEEHCLSHKGAVMAFQTLKSF